MNRFEHNIAISFDVVFFYDFFNYLYQKYYPYNYDMLYLLGVIIVLIT